MKSIVRCAFQSSGEKFEERVEKLLFGKVFENNEEESDEQVWKSKAARAENIHNGGCTRPNTPCQVQYLHDDIE